MKRGLVTTMKRTNRFAGKLFEALVREEEVREKQNLYRSLVKPLVYAVKNGGSIIDIGCGIGSAERFLLEMLSKGTKLNLTLIDYNEQMLNYACERIKRIAKQRGVEVRVKSIKGDFVELNLSLLKGEFDGVLLGSVIHELYGQGGIEKVKRGIKVIYELLKEGGTLSFYEFVDLAPNEYLSFKNFRFSEEERRRKFLGELRDRWEKAMELRSEFSPNYPFFKEEKLPKALVIDTIVGVAVKESPEHLHTLCFSEEGVHNLFEPNEFYVLKREKHKFENILTQQARRCGIENAEEIIRNLPPDRYLMIMRKVYSNK